MVNISKDVVQDKVQHKILSDLLIVLTQGANTQDTRVVWQELVTESEQLQLAKRLAIVVLLIQGVPYSAIQQTLKVSPSTISSHEEQLKNSAYASLEKLIDSKSKHTDVMEVIDKLLTLGLPRYTDRYRYKWLRE